MIFYELLKGIITKLGLTVRTEAQALTEEQKAQVRENIETMSKDEVENKLDTKLELIPHMIYEDIAFPYDNWQSIAYGNGKFVVVANGKYTKKVIYSIDGVNWIETTLPSYGYWGHVTYGNDKFLVVKSTSNIGAYSTDGITWIETTLPSSSSWAFLTYGNDKFILASKSSNVAYYSENGIDWEETTIPIDTDKYSYAATYGNGKFVVIGRMSEKAVYSEDGIIWYETTMPKQREWKSIAYGNGKFIAIEGGANGKIAYSEDGVNWTESTKNNGNYGVYVTYGNSKFVALFSHNIAYSSDGNNWNIIDSPFNQKGAARLLAYGDGKFIAISASTATSLAEIAISADGINWTNQKETGEYYYTMSQNNTDVTAEIQTIAPVISVNGLTGDVNILVDYAQNDSSAPNYIKNRTHWTEFSEEVILSETNTNEIVGSIGLVDSKTYVVTLDGEKYTCVAMSQFSNGLTTTTGLGNLNINYPDYYEDTGEPFFIEEDFDLDRVYIFTKTGGEHTISISRLIESSVHQLDEKYIPDTIARVKDIPIITVEDIDEICGQTIYYSSEVDL